MVWSHQSLAISLTCLDIGNTGSTTSCSQHSQVSRLFISGGGRNLIAGVFSRTVRRDVWLQARSLWSRLPRTRTWFLDFYCIRWSNRRQDISDCTTLYFLSNVATSLRMCALLIDVGEEWRQRQTRVSRPCAHLRISVRARWSFVSYCVIPFSYSFLRLDCVCSWYGWSAQAATHWIVPILGTGIFGFGMMAT